MAESSEKLIPFSRLSPLLMMLYPMSTPEKEFLRRWIDLPDPDAEFFSVAEFVGYASGLQEIATARSAAVGAEAKSILLQIVKDIGKL